MTLKKSAVYGISISAGVLVVAAVVVVVVLVTKKKGEGEGWGCDASDPSPYKCSPMSGGPYKSQADCRCIFNVGKPGPQCQCVYDPKVKNPKKRFATADECKADAEAKCGWLYACE
jgi:hypothetical protein